MLRIDAERLITEVTNALRNSVPLNEHQQLLKALERCFELIGRSLPYIKSAGIRKEMAIYANILEGYFQNGELKYYPMRADMWLHEEGEKPTRSNLKGMLRKKGINIPEEPRRRKPAAKPVKEPKRRGRK